MMPENRETAREIMGKGKSCVCPEKGDRGEETSTGRKRVRRRKKPPHVYTRKRKEDPIL